MNRRAAGGCWEPVIHGVCHPHPRRRRTGKRIGKQRARHAAKFICAVDKIRCGNEHEVTRLRRGRQMRETQSVQHIPFSSSDAEKRHITTSPPPFLYPSFSLSLLPFLSVSLTALSPALFGEKIRKHQARSRWEQKEERG